MDDVTLAIRLAIASLVGVGVGLERQWSGHSTGEQARFAGLRTFTMLGLLGGIAGLLLSTGHSAAGAVAIGGGLAIAVVAYAMAVRRPHMETEGTTEVAALLVVTLGALAGIGRLTLAGGAGALIVLALHEKQRLHHAVTHLQETELRAALRFSVLALVVLPLLPEGPVLGTLAVRPRALWIIVLIFSAINFAAFVVRRFAGPGRGYGLVGMLGGLISSTAVTLDFSRRSRREPGMSRSLASGVIGACTVLMPRVLVVSAVLQARVALALLPLLLPALAIGSVFVVRDWIAGRAADDASGQPPPGNPLRLAMAVRMALLFQVAMTAIDLARTLLDKPGFYATAAALGLTDVDALTVGMSRPAGEIPAGLAARAIAVGILANTALKLSMSLILGTPGFRRATALGLGVLGIAIAVALSVM